MLFFSISVSLLAAAGSVVAAPTLHHHARDRENGTLLLIGVNIAGFDFGCSIHGSCHLSQVTPPLTSLGGVDGVGQMRHFAKDDGMDIFRLPVGWQYLVNKKLGGDLDAENAGNYDQLVQACLATGSHCVIDIHNYARWNGKIIGQGGPSNAQFVSLWTQLAEKYAGTDKVIFGVMNEPHDVPNIDKWVETVQAVVTAIRKAGAKTQMILLPGDDWTSAEAMARGSGPLLLEVKNPDGSTDGLVFDVHMYLDSDLSGTHPDCVTDNIDFAFQPLATWLRSHKRQALTSETGGGNTSSCEKYLCRQIQFFHENADVFLGYTGWSAGAFNPETYHLSEVPTKKGNKWEDTALVKACLVRKPSTSG
ncbi:glycoside hydrolase family 5 protein [Cercophora scortea]|uniref:Endoglucanase EG-II n=1 Tax=Cercophora scortea TaxID=314031 RepID=A0AAE0IW96_9PEZI|nr:glycoside hydrolase family 5 protein [Cercophora scortea]